MLSKKGFAYWDSLVGGENSSPMGQDYHIAAFANPGNLKKKVQTQFTSWIQSILYLWISASKTAVFGVKIQIDEKLR